MKLEFLTPTLSVLLPLGLLLFFPSEIFGPLPDPPSAERYSCAFVTLTPDEERSALAAARTSWQIDRDTTRRVRIPLFAEELPQRPALSIGTHSMHAPSGEDAPYAPDWLPRTHAALAPTTISTLKTASGKEKTFSRDDLLKLD